MTDYTEVQALLGKVEAAYDEALVDARGKITTLVEGSLYVPTYIPWYIIALSSFVCNNCPGGCSSIPNR